MGGCKTYILLAKVHFDLGIMLVEHYVLFH